jgi:hypothetical protein
VEDGEDEDYALARGAGGPGKSKGRTPADADDDGDYGFARGPKGGKAVPGRVRGKAAEDESDYTFAKGRRKPKASASDIYAIDTNAAADERFEVGSESSGDYESRGIVDIDSGDEAGVASDSDGSEAEDGAAPLSGVT